MLVTFKLFGGKGGYLLLKFWSEQRACAACARIIFPLFERGSCGARPFIHSSDTFNKLYVHNTIKSGPVVVR